MYHVTSQAHNDHVSIRPRADGRWHRLLAPCLFVAAAVVGFAPATAPAAIWQGGSGDWTNPAKWNLGAGANDYPGSASFPSEGATMHSHGPGVVTIKAGDNIVLNANLFMGTGGASVSQTGGTFEAQLRIDNRTEYHISGGTLTDDGSVGLWVTGGTFHVSDNGAWVRKLSTTSVEFKAPGSTIHVSGGTLTIGRVKMDESGVGARVFRVTGTAATHIEVDTLNLYPNAAGGTATAEFIFDAGGVDAINVTASGGGAKLIIDGGAGNQGDLFADVSAYGPTAGIQGFVLLDYFLPNRRFGQFGNVTVVGAAGPLTLGANANSLLANQYFITYDDAVVGDGSAIVLYMNVAPIPEPATAAMACLGLGGLLTLRPRRGA